MQQNGKTKFEIPVVLLSHLGERWITLSIGSKLLDPQMLFILAFY